MVKVKSISIEQAKSLKRTMKPSPVVEEYTQILRDLPAGEAREIDARTEKEKANTIKNRILRVKKTLKMDDLQVRRVNDRVVFWRENQD